MAQVYEPEPCSRYSSEVREASRDAWYGTVVSNDVAFVVRESGGHEHVRTAEETGPLRVSLTCDRTSTPLHGPATCTVTLTNVGMSPLLLNQRFAVSYPWDPMCDLFFDILKDGKPYRGGAKIEVGEFAASSKPVFLHARHYRLVQLGETLTCRIHLDGFYRFPEGRYHIRAAYVPEPSEVAPDAWSGVVRSNPIVLDVLEGT